ncbi:Protein Y37D8A.16 [Aphelenchoides avenae]|nr:Protein Y37D8A.16 [Aphelenchus avenae]
MAVPAAFLAGFALKVLITILTIIVLILIDARYISAYITVQYEIILLYFVAALTLLYVVVSSLLYVLLIRTSRNGEELRLTNCALTEILFACIGVVLWILVAGIGGTVAQSTILSTGNAFGWLAAAGGVNACLFIGIAAVFAPHIAAKCGRGKSYAKAVSEEASAY